jgi:predicted house-cleaning noncanonical NTP pyrophosphatase (MazG superfamily)
MGIKYNKLVRDKIPDILKSKGKEPLTHIAGDEEYYEKLLEKLSEEVGEFLKENTLEELADILEVIYAIKDYKFNDKNLEKMRKEKQYKRGGFKERIILDEVKENNSEPYS